MENDSIYHHFVSLDDLDIWNAIKEWQNNSDEALSWLCNGILNRKLFKVSIFDTEISESTIDQLSKEIQNKFKEDPTNYYSTGILTNAAYISSEQKIQILTGSGNIKDIIEFAELPNIAAMSKIVKKYYLCWPKNISL